MEAHDMFGAGIEVQDDDPFAGGEEWEGFGDIDAPVEAVQAAETGFDPSLPVVDKEGEVIAKPAPRVAAEAAAKESLAALKPEIHSQPMQNGSDHQEQQAKLRAIAEREAQEAAAKAGPATAPLVESHPEPEPAAKAEPEAVEEGELPVEMKDKNGKTTKRRYVLLQLTAPGKFEQVYWYEDKAGRMVTKATPGAKRQTVTIASNSEQALKIGYAALGSPVDGVHLVACAMLHFQPRHVRMALPEPTRMKLQIS